MGKVRPTAQPLPPPAQREDSPEPPEPAVSSQPKIHPGNEGELAKLRDKIATLSRRASFLESSNRKLSRQLSCRPRAVARESPDAKTMAAMKDAVEKLREENQRLEKSLEGSQSQILRLQQESKVIIDSTEEALGAARLQVLRLRQENKSLSGSLVAAQAQMSVLQQGRVDMAESLEEAKSLIFSLQPWVRDVTSEEIGKEYDYLIDGVTDCVEKLISQNAPEITDRRGTSHHWQRHDAGPFVQYLQRHIDLIHASMFPETDEDILTALILRFIHDNIMEIPLYGACTDFVMWMRVAEDQMQKAVQPKRDAFSVRNWAAESYNAILSHPRFPQERAIRSASLAAELVGIVSPLVLEGIDEGQSDSLQAALEESCIAPAIALHEKVIISTQQFYLESNPLINCNPNGRISSSPNLYDTLPQLTCSNILQNRKKFDVTQLGLSREDVMRGVVPVLTIAPALYVRRLGRADELHEPAIVRPQRILVAWGSPEKKAAYIDSGERTLVNTLLGSPR